MAGTLPPYHTKTLKNGLEVVAIPMPGHQVISVDLFYKVGSRNEIMGKSGIAHMLEHLNFKSTETMKAGEFDEHVKRFGGINNASTGFDFTHYFIKASNRNLDRSLELLADMMGNLKLLDEEFQPERDVVAEERRWRTDNNPTGFLYFSLFNNAYVYHPYHWTPIGFMNDIQTWKIKDIRDFHKTFYQPKNAILVVSGGVETEALFKAAEAHFGKIKNRGPIPEVHMAEPEQPGARRVELEKESEVEMVAISWHVPNFENEDSVALNAIGELLSSGQSSRFQEVLVDKKRLANNIYAYQMDLKDPGVFIVMAICNPGVKAETVEKAILAEIDKLKQGKVKKTELEKVKINTKADFVYALENSSDVSNLFGSFLARGNIEPLLTYEAQIDALEVETVTEAAKKYFVKEHSTTVILRKPEQTAETTEEKEETEKGV